MRLELFPSASIALPPPPPPPVAAFASSAAVSAVAIVAVDVDPPPPRALVVVVVDATAVAAVAVAAVAVAAVASASVVASGATSGVSVSAAAALSTSAAVENNLFFELNTIKEFFLPLIFLLQHPKLAKVSRRFLIVEGIYMNQGTLCDIDRMIELKRKHKLRLFIDETVSFGTVGEHGRGITELKGVSMRDIDLIMGSLETSIGSIGGFCVGTTYVVEHQTLAGLGTIPRIWKQQKVLHSTSCLFSLSQATASPPPCPPCWRRGR